MPAQRRDSYGAMQTIAQGRIATNAGLLQLAPKKDQSARGRLEALDPLSALPGGIGDGLAKQLPKALPPATNDAERLAQRLGSGHLKGVGWVGDAAELAMAKDKKRALAGIAGSRAATAAASFVPPQIVTMPLAAVLGSWAGKELYDHAPEYVARARALVPTLKDQLGRELTRYVPYDLQDRVMRR